MPQLASAGQFIKGYGTLLQSVDSIAINIYFNKIPSFLFASVLFYDTVWPVMATCPGRRRRIVFLVPHFVARCK